MKAVSLLDLMRSPDSAFLRGLYYDLGQTALYKVEFLDLKTKKETGEKNDDR
jgi:hypothetical protein